MTLEIGYWTPDTNTDTLIFYISDQRADGVNIIPRDFNQQPLFDVCSVCIDQQTGEMSIQIKAHNDDV